MKISFTHFKSIFLLALGLCAFGSSALAEVGDTTVVRTHDETHWNWYGSWDEDVEFPTFKSEKILMDFTLGCPQGGCSEWDYTSRIELRHDTGVPDSSVAALDTISTDPWIVDTTWNYFTVIETYDLGRVMTPYSGDKNYGWFHTWTFDVTDFSPLLKGNTTIRAFYGGWQDGFTITVDFKFIEGVPERDVLSVQNIWRSGAGGFQYGNVDNPINEQLDPKSIYIEPETRAAKIRVIASGHSFGGAENCAEFCKKNYYLDIGGIPAAFSNLIWRDDCGLVTAYPQTGTWIYNRAGWCPGGKTTIFEHEITPLIIPGQNLDIDMTLDSYTYNGGAGFHPNYILDVQLVTYDDPNHVLDIAVDDILTPNSADEHSRYNPVCHNPSIRVKNNGTTAINSFYITYGVEGGIECYHQWTGNLGFGETVDVDLPQFNWLSNTANGNPIFFAEVSQPNYQDTEPYLTNNRLAVPFDVPTRYDLTTIVFTLRTNSQPHENSWTLKNSAGEILYSGDNFSANTTYEIEFQLNNFECYTFELLDYDVNFEGGDGLSWWANNDGAGYARFYDTQGNLITNFDPDFGSNIFHEFTVGYTLVDHWENVVCEYILSDDTEPTITTSNNLEISITPNPVADDMKATVEFNQPETGHISVLNVLGQEIHRSRFEESNKAIFEMDMSKQVAGIYILEVHTQAGVESKRFAVAR